LPHALLVLFRHEILTLGCDEVRAVDGKKRLAFAKILIRGICEDFLDVAGVPHLHGGEARFINRDIASDVDLVFDDFAFHTPGSDANALQTLRRKLNGHERSFVRRHRRTFPSVRRTLGRSGRRRLHRGLHLRVLLRAPPQPAKNGEESEIAHHGQ